MTNFQPCTSGGAMGIELFADFMHTQQDIQNIQDNSD
jgi:hypothetical protein